MAPLNSVLLRCRECHWPMTCSFGKTRRGLFAARRWQLTRLNLAAHRRIVLQRFSPTLCVDELHLGVYTLMLATDPLADLPVGFALVGANDKDHMSRFLCIGYGGRRSGGTDTIRIVGGPFAPSYFKDRIRDTERFRSVQNRHRSLQLTHRRTDVGRPALRADVGEIRRS